MLKKIIKILLVLTCFLLQGCKANDEHKQNLAMDYEKVIINKGTVDYHNDYKMEIIIDGEDVTLSNVDCERLIITEKVTEGNVFINNVKCDEIEIFGGGKYAVYINDCDVNTVNVLKKHTPIRAVFKGNTRVSNVIDDGNIIEVTNTAKLHTLSVHNGAKVYVEEQAIVDNITVGVGYVSIENNAKINEIIINSEAELKGFGEVAVLKKNSNLFLKGNAIN